MKIFKMTIVGFTVLSLCAAPALQANQLSETVEQLNQPCGCCCCDSPSKELSCSVNGFQKNKSCPCKVDSPTPINAIPIASTTSNTNQSELALNVKNLTNQIFTDVNKTNEFVEIDYLPQKHPPLFILNASLLI